MIAIPCRGAIHGERKRLDDECFARIEMRVEAAMVRPASFIKSTTLMPSAPR
jgi:hypothetical protein